MSKAKKIFTMEELIDIVEDKLDEYMVVQQPEDLFKSMRYTVLLPGKRLRPVMCLETCRMLKGDIEKALPTACAIEMLHAQTLIHDDLPCMDNDDFRRGKISNHRMFGEAVAVLAGDALLTFAPQIILKNSDALSDECKLKLLNEYHNYAGAYGVIAGQVIDIQSEKGEIKDNKNEILRYIHLHKTADLFKLSIRSGAIIAGADDEKMAMLTEFAEKLGLAFQIADDVLDETSTFEALGKTPGKDKYAGKLTYVSLFGIDNAKCKLTCLFKECYDIMNTHEFNSQIFIDIIEGIKKRVKL